MPFCPLMSYTNQKADCSPECALFQSSGQTPQCGLLSLHDRVTDGFNALEMQIREIKTKF